MRGLCGFCASAARHPHIRHESGGDDCRPRSSPNSCRRSAVASLPRPCRPIVSSRAFSSAPRPSATPRRRVDARVQCSGHARSRPARQSLCCFSSRTSRRCFPAAGGPPSARNGLPQADTDIPAWAAPDRTSAHSSSGRGNRVFGPPPLRTRGLVHDPPLFFAEQQKANRFMDRQGRLPAFLRNRQRCSSTGRETRLSS